MSGTEVLVILFGLFIGYWLVSRLVAGGRPDAADPPVASHGSDGQRADDPFASGPPWHVVLGVRADAGVDEIRAAHRALAARPDATPAATNGDEARAAAESRSREIDLAYRQAMQARGATP